MHSNSPGFFKSSNTTIANHLITNPSDMNEDDVNANSVIACNDDYLDEWISPIHVPRSRSWFCCANDGADARQPNLRRRPLSCHYSIVRNEPKSQSDIVNVNFFKVYLFQVFSLMQSRMLKINFTSPNQT